jgi:predicted NBD/HSP70 family sugar kinase
MGRALRKPSEQLTVIVLESRWAEVYSCMADSLGSIECTLFKRWDPSPYLTDASGARLLEEIGRQVRLSWHARPQKPSGVALTLPGTLDGSEAILSSRRLGIRETCAVAEELRSALEVPCRAFHDVECLAVGENRQSTRRSDVAGETFVYVFVDEGVGSKTLIDGKAFLGAGVAGTLGRLTVQPDGSYYQALAARGPLEVYSSRPWVSENLVSMYLSEHDKKAVPGHDEENLEDTRFRRALRAAAGGDWRGLDYAHIADGAANHDPIAAAVLEVAARYLGLAINSILTVLHPHRIVLGGAMITDIPEFANQVIGYARRYSWPLAWNSTDVSVSFLGRQAQVLGAMELWTRFLDH